MEFVSVNPSVIVHTDIATITHPNVTSHACQPPHVGMWDSKEERKKKTARHRDRGRKPGDLADRDTREKKKRQDSVHATITHTHLLARTDVQENRDI